MRYLGGEIHDGNTVNDSVVGCLLNYGPLLWTSVSHGSFGLVHCFNTWGSNEILNPQLAFSSSLLSCPNFCQYATLRK
jgi:hypothetical protein